MEGVFISGPLPLLSQKGSPKRFCCPKGRRSVSKALHFVSEKKGKKQLSPFARIPRTLPSAPASCTFFVALGKGGQFLHAWVTLHFVHTSSHSSASKKSVSQAAKETSFGTVGRGLFFPDTETLSKCVSITCDKRRRAPRRTRGRGPA